MKALKSDVELSEVQIHLNECPVCLSRVQSAVRYILTDQAYSLALLRDASRHVWYAAVGDR